MSKYPEGHKDAEGVYQFKSKITQEFVMAHQWIAEVAVDRKAKKERVALPYKYWNDGGKWAKEYRGQVTQAGRLLKTYHPQALINAMVEVKWCWSLRAPQLLAAIKKHDKVIRANKERLKNTKKPEVVENTNFQKQKTNIMEKQRKK